MLEFLRENEGSLFALLGVLIGGFISLLGPYISSKIEDSKINKNLKPEIIKCTFEFFQLRKHYLQTINIHNFEMRKSQIFFNASISPEYSPEKKQELQKVYNAINSESDRDNVYKYLDQLTQTEAQLIALVTKVNDYFGVDVYESVYKILKPHLDNSNQSSNIHNYESLSPAQIDAMNMTFRDDVMKEGQKFDIHCNDVIRHLMSLLRLR